MAKDDTLKVAFAARLRQAMNIRNVKAATLSRMTGLSESQISSYLNCKYEAKQEALDSLARALDVEIAWLMGLNVPMQRKDVFPVSTEVVEIYIIGKISAGLPILAVENIIGKAPAPSSQIKKGYNYFYLMVEGDSMNLKFHDKDMVLVQQQPELENDEIGVILIDDEATVKKYRNENGLIILEPMSTNPEHRTQIYNPKEHNIKIIGKVIAYQGQI